MSGEERAADYNCRVYTAELLDHFQNPRNPGEVEKPDAKVRVENPACGDILELSVKLEEGRISEIRFRAKGCVPTMACGSAITELAKGRTVEEARAITKEDILRTVGGVPEASRHAAFLAMDALQAVLRKK